jgi:hypothetical protein
MIMHVLTALKESNGGEASTEDVAKAKEAVAAGKKVLQESA